MEGFVRCRGLFATAVLAALLAACQPPADEPAAGGQEGDPADPPAALEATPVDASALEALGVRNARQPVPGLITSGQPTPEQLEALRELGVTRFISLRWPEESGAGWEEARSEAEGFVFTRLPIAGADGLTREHVERLDALLDQAGEGATALYCGSSNRVGAMLALRAYWLEGASPEDALAVGRAAGLAGLEGEVRRILGIE
ncbi:MAG: hypothetical protein D6701_14000 [Gemmatimonadetes bacterium]|nr:MAG: hypothetical protein D6701_14000 [Gemmatimonadota bacterium]